MAGLSQASWAAWPHWAASLPEVISCRGVTSIVTRAPLEADALSALASPETQIDGQGRLIITAAGTDEQKLLRTALHLGTVRELGPVRHRLTEIFREVLTTTSHEGTADTNETKEAHR